jgi:sulfur relay (sulfurtransferase) complex TusBCD TusD component (DsrE family)
MDAWVDEGALVEAARRSSLDELADWTLWADKVVSF